MNKIDYWGGLHGNYLELIVNVFIYENGYDVSQDLFDANGSCHKKNQDPSYVRHIHAYHFSFDDRPIQANDLVIRIVPDRDDLLIALTNSFLRAGDQEIDLDRFSATVTASHKGQAFVDNLSRTSSGDLSRSAVRGYFYAMLQEPQHGLDNMIKFNTVPHKVYNFPFRAFFDLAWFYRELNAIADFLGFNFYPTVRLAEIHRQFLAINQGLQSEIRCHAAWADIVSNQSRVLSLNVLEEAWINAQIANSLRAYDLVELNGEQFPTNTAVFAGILFDWKTHNR